MGMRHAARRMKTRYITTYIACSSIMCMQCGGAGGGGGRIQQAYRCPEAPNFQEDALTSINIQAVNLKIRPAKFLLVARTDTAQNKQ